MTTHTTNPMPFLVCNEPEPRPETSADIRARLARDTDDPELKSILSITDAALRLHLLKQYKLDHDPIHLPKGPA